jgi:diguanylate cyclase (GGDEF)-like protein
VIALVMVFGMFNMRAEAVRAVCLYTLALVGAVMALRARTDALVYPARLEWFYFVLLATVLATISQLSVQLMDMRLRLKTQKLALENALARIQEIATRDELTALPNRRTMMGLLQDHALRRARGGLAFYVAMVDLDHFKHVNDTFGHAVGDEALRAFAAQAQAVLRNTDAIGRWGGEEFLLVLPESPPGQPTVGVERLRAQLAGLAVCAAAPELRISFSAGFTRYRDGEPVGQAIERADRALYEAKSSGRNRTVML